jgi:hypothetical protein
MRNHNGKIKENKNAQYCLAITVAVMIKANDSNHKLVLCDLGI